MIHLKQRLKAAAMIGNQISKHGDWNSPLVGERSEVDAAPQRPAVMQFRTQDRAKATADATAAEPDVSVLLFHSAATRFEERLLMRGGVP